MSEQTRATENSIDDPTDDENTCENGQEGCCGPDGDDLPCPACFGLTCAFVDEEGA